MVELGFAPAIGGFGLCFRFLLLAERTRQSTARSLAGRERRGVLPSVKVRRETKDLPLCPRLLLRLAHQVLQLSSRCLSAVRRAIKGLRVPYRPFVLGTLSCSSAHDPWNRLFTPSLMNCVNNERSVANIDTRSLFSTKLFNWQRDGNQANRIDKRARVRVEWGERDIFIWRILAVR